MNDDLTECERNLAERFRNSLFDLSEDEYGEGLLDPSHPEFPAVLAIAFPPRPRRLRKPKAPRAGTQERFDI